jgi:Zn-dependent peptidase ImmA (M78 family)
MRLDYIIALVESQVTKQMTRDPYELCKQLGVKIIHEDLPPELKAYYMVLERGRRIVLNTNLSRELSRVLVAHELGHDSMHREIARMQCFKEFEMFGITSATEYEANLYCAELLIADEDVLELFNDEESTIHGIARELSVPLELIDFKILLLKHKGYRLNVNNTARSNFLRHHNDLGERFEDM